MEKSSILILPLPSGKKWTGLTIHQEPLGGSEAAVAYTARALAKRGHQVVVAGHMDLMQTNVDGVAYIHNSQILELSKQPWDYIISSRWADVLRSFDWHTKKMVFWAHDMPHVCRCK
jgi:exonuclease III